MSNEYNKRMKRVLKDAFLNGLAIFCISFGIFLLTSNGSMVQGMYTSFSVFLIRFSMRLYKEENIDMEGLEDMVGLNLGGDESDYNKNDLLNILGMD